MWTVSNISLLLLSLSSFLSPTLARQTPTSYCKCICFQNSTIIPLNSPPDQKPPPSDGIPGSRKRSPDSVPRAVSSYQIPRDPIDTLLQSRDGDQDEDDNGSGNKHHRTLTCADCNRAFCLDYNLPICKGAKEEDVFTSCFQRDSVKDETVVLLFILLTASLLSWAILKPWIDKIRDPSSVSTYAPVTSNGNTSSNRGARGGLAGSLLPRTEGSYRDHAANTRDRGNSDSIARQGGLNS